MENLSQENTEQQVLAVKVLQPHDKDINPSKPHITVVRPNYCQSLKEWTVRVINEKGACLHSFKNKDKEIVVQEWKSLMKECHNVEDAVW